MNTPGFRSVQFRRLSSSSIAWISPIRLSKSKAFREPDPPPEPSDLRSRPPKGMSEEEAISAMRQSKDPQSALEIFNAAAEQKEFRHSTATYSMILHRLAHARKFKAVDAVLRQMTHEARKFHEGPFMNLMTHFSRASMHERVLEMFSAISDIGGEKPSRKAFTKCLNLLVEAGRVDLARKLLLGTRKTRRLKPNTCVFNIVVKHHCKTGDLASAFAVVEEMRRSCESLPNVITYSVLMKSLCERGRLREAMELFERMIGEDKIKPDEFTYDVLIRGFCRGGDVGKARKIVEFMRRNGCEPNVFNYTALIDGLCKAGAVGEAEGVLSKMRSLGIKLDVIGYTVLIEGLCGAGRSGDALKLLREMRRSRVRPKSVTFRAILTGLCRERRFGEALDILGWRLFEVNEAGHRVVMRTLCDEGELGKASGVLKLTLERGFVPHFETTNVLLARLCAARRVDDAVKALIGLIGAGFNPEPDSWALMVDFVSKARKSVAFRLLDELITLADRKSRAKLIEIPKLK